MGTVAPQNMLSFTEYLPGVLIRTERTDEPTMFLLARDPILHPPPFPPPLPPFDLFSYCWLELNDHSCSLLLDMDVCVCVCVRESLRGMTSPRLMSAKPFTHTYTHHVLLQSGFCAIPPSWNHSRATSAHIDITQPRVTGPHTNIQRSRSHWEISGCLMH